MNTIRRRFSRQDGQAAVELMGSIWFMLLCAMLGWQLLLVTATVTAAENAARNGARQASMGGNAQAAALESLPPWLSSGATVNGGLDTTVSVRVPIVVPGLHSEAIRISRHAVMPRTDR